MSVIVAVRKSGRIVMAADSQSNFDQHKDLAPNLRICKIMKVGSAYLAASGWGLYENILHDYLKGQKRPALNDQRQVFAFFLRFWKALRKKYSFVNDQGNKEDKTPFADLDATFLVVSRGGIFQVSSDMSVNRFEQFQTIGSGCDYATGALHALYDQKGLDAETLARKAVEAAIRFNIYCGGEIQVVRVAG